LPAAVRHELALLFLSYCNLGSSDDGTGEGGAKQVDVLVNGVAWYGLEAELFDELVVEILDVALLRTDLQGLLAGCLEVLFLADRGHKALFN
jgi:hypothetical protein